MNNAEKIPPSRQPADPNSPFLTVPQAANYFSKSEITIHRWLKAGHLKKKQIAGSTYVDMREAGAA